MFCTFLERLYHFKVAKKVKIGGKWPKLYRFLRKPALPETIFLFAKQVESVN